MTHITNHPRIYIPSVPLLALNYDNPKDPRYYQIFLFFSEVHMLGNDFHSANFVLFYSLSNLKIFIYNS